jgi:hypothetical protein
MILKDKLTKAIYSKEYLKRVMNMDFSKPTEKMKKIAES